MAVLRWGIAGAGSICDDFAAAVRKLPIHEHDVGWFTVVDAGLIPAFVAVDCFQIQLPRLPFDCVFFQIIAVGARDAGRAAAFAQKFGIGKSYGSYEELAQDKDVGVWSR